MGAHGPQQQVPVGLAKSWRESKLRKMELPSFDDRFMSVRLSSSNCIGKCHACVGRAGPCWMRFRLSC